MQYHKVSESQLTEPYNVIHYVADGYDHAE